MKFMLTGVLPSEGIRASLAKHALNECEYIIVKSMPDEKNKCVMSNICCIQRFLLFIISRIYLRYISVLCKVYDN